MSLEKNLKAHFGENVSFKQIYVAPVCTEDGRKFLKFGDPKREINALLGMSAAFLIVASIGIAAQKLTHTHDVDGKRSSIPSSATYFSERHF